MNRSLIVIVILFAAVASFWLGMKPESPSEPEAPVTKHHSGEAAIGGAFTLVNTSGETVTQDALLGKFSLVFFGFTHCPDICPTGLSTMSDAMNALPEALSAVLTPVFITVDPARDTPERMAEYVANFHPSMLALTGSDEAVKQAVAAYKVYAAKGEEEASGHYLMDHSGFLYLMGPDGTYRKHFTYNQPLEELVAAITAEMQQ